MLFDYTPKKLLLIVTIVFAVFIPVIFLIDWLDENVVNPRIWKNWSCEEMKEFAMKFEDEKLSKFQRAVFHEDLSKCLQN